MGKCFSSASWSKIFSQPGEFLICVFFGLNKKKVLIHIWVFSLNPASGHLTGFFFKLSNLIVSLTYWAAVHQTIPLVEQQK